MGAYDAYQGFTADPTAPLSERFGNAGNSVLSGATFGLFGSDPEEIAERARLSEKTTEEIATAATAATAASEVPTARPISELSTAEEFSEERNRLDQLVQQNTITRQEQIDLLGELRDRERELAETAYQASQVVGPPVPPSLAMSAASTVSETPSLAMSAASTVSETPSPDQTVTSITPPVVPNTASSTAPVVTTTQPAANTNTNTEINDIMMMLSYKLDTMIALLDTGVGIQDRLLLESRS
jgi:hypothetical protein